MAVKTNQKTYLSWDDIESAVDDLCQQIPFELPNIDSIHGIARGGLIPAVLISHKLGLPYVGLVGPNTLVVDDICDTGVTLDKGPGVYTAVLHYKPHTSCFQPTMWSEIHNGDEWLIYPWETKDSLPIQDYLKSKEFLDFADLQDAPNLELDTSKKSSYIAGMTNDEEGSFMKFQNKLKNNE
tara:strand:+ start:411 stop:956 length:546 start_codon:yes stop_codon:yes gene_type:complete